MHSYLSMKKTSPEKVGSEIFHNFFTAKNGVVDYRAGVEAGDGASILPIPGYLVPETATWLHGAGAGSK